jgi:hypothetical protein
MPELWQQLPQKPGVGKAKSSIMLAVTQLSSQLVCFAARSFFHFVVIVTFPSFIRCLLEPSDWTLQILLEVLSSVMLSCTEVLKQKMKARVTISEMAFLPVRW